VSGKIHLERCCHFSFYSFLHNPISNHMNLTMFPMIYCPNGNIYRLVTERRTYGIKHHNFSDIWLMYLVMSLCHSITIGFSLLPKSVQIRHTDRRINFLFYCTQRQTWKKYNHLEKFNFNRIFFACKRSHLVTACGWCGLIKLNRIVAIFATFSDQLITWSWLICK